METNNGVPAFYARTRQQWRKWLEKNAEKKTEVCLVIYHKGSEIKSVSYNDAIEEALCFGWIDSKANKRDPESVYQRFSPRKPNSKWSRRNIERVERMMAEKKMTSMGQRLIDIAKKSGAWQAALQD